MKKKTLTVAIILSLCGSMLLTSCIGSFSLTNKVLAWNKQIGSKFVNEIVFVAFCILPVYEISALADVLVLNSIEFWSGENPVEAYSYTVDGKNGERYLVECDGKGYTVTNTLDQTSLRFDFNEATQEWSFEKDGQNIVFMTFIDDTHVKVPLRDGTEMIVETSQNGLYAYQTAVAASDMASL